VYRRHNSDGDTLWRGLARRVNLLRVQEPEQPRLGLQRQVADSEADDEPPRAASS